MNQRIDYGWTKVEGMEYDKDEMNEWKELDRWTSDGVMSMLEEGQTTETYNHNEYIGMVGIKIQNES